MGDLSLLLPILLYLAATLVIARTLVARQRSSESFTQGYFLGGQFMGGTLLALALVTTYTSASSFIGGPGAAYKFGLGWVLLAMIQVPVALLTLGVLGPKLWRLAKEQGAVTILDVLDKRYHSPVLLVLAGVSLLAAFIGMVVVQFAGGAKLLAVMTGVDYGVGLAIFVGTVLIYTLWGGFRAVSYTDALQGLVMIFGMLALFIGLLYQGGGISNLTAELAAQDPALLHPKGPNEFLSWPFLMSFWVLVCLGTIGLPHTVLRTMAVKDMNALRRAMILGTIVSSIVILLPHLSGVLGRALLPELTSPDEVMPRLMVTLFPPMIAGLLLAAPMAAVMSSVDSMLLQSSSTLVRDLVMRHKPLSEKSQKIFSYSTTVALTFICALLALEPPQMIIWLNLASLGALQVVFLWPLVLGLFWRKATALAAISSMLSGLGLFLYWTFASIKPLGLHAVVPSLAISGLVFVLAVLLKPQRVMDNEQA